MATKPLTDEQIKLKTARLCELCEELWPDEWPGKYVGTQVAFKDWLNTKTSLSVNHMIDKSAAITAWLDKLEELAEA